MPPADLQEQYRWLRYLYGDDVSLQWHAHILADIVRSILLCKVQVRSLPREMKKKSDIGTAKEES